jgi:hypothetical protein
MEFAPAESERRFGAGWRGLRGRLLASSGRVLDQTRHGGRPAALLAGRFCVTFAGTLSVRRSP